MPCEFLRIKSAVKGETNSKSWDAFHSGLVEEQLVLNVKTFRNNYTMDLTIVIGGIDSLLL